MYSRARIGGGLCQVGGREGSGSLKCLERHTSKCVCAWNHRLIAWKDVKMACIMWKATWCPKSHGVVFFPCCFVDPALISSYLCLTSTSRFQKCRAQQTSLGEVLEIKPFNPLTEIRLAFSFPASHTVRKTHSWTMHFTKKEKAFV